MANYIIRVYGILNEDNSQSDYFDFSINIVNCGNNTTTTLMAPYVSDITYFFSDESTITLPAF